MLKKLSYLAVVLYFTFLYGQNLYEFGSDFRKDFYFIGMSVVSCLFSFILFKSFKNKATSFYFFLCIGEFLNQSLFSGSYNYIDITFGIIGIIYILAESKISQCLNGIKRIILSVKNPRLFLFLGLALAVPLLFYRSFMSLLNILFHF